MKAVISYWKYDFHCKDTKKALAEIDGSEIRQYLLEIRRINLTRAFLKRGDEMAFLLVFSSCLE